jgi:hypothetical protein
MPGCFGEQADQPLAAYQALPGIQRDGEVFHDQADDPGLGVVGVGVLDAAAPGAVEQRERTSLLRI